MNSSVDGPDCTDPDLCHSDCCHIMIDVPRFLVDYYISSKLAKESDFVRGDVFCFKIAINSKMSRCVFYSRELNGCRIHRTMMKPLHCWIYPTGFDPNPSDDKKFADDGTIMCKKSKGWRILDEKKALKASKILDKYVNHCREEFLLENSEDKIKQRLKNIRQKIELFAPKSIAGFKDGIYEFEPLQSEGISLKLKKICDQFCKNGNNLDYFECKNTCETVAEKVILFLKNNVLKLVKSQGLEVDGHYPLYQILGVSQTFFNSFQK